MGIHIVEYISLNTYRMWPQILRMACHGGCVKDLPCEMYPQQGDAHWHSRVITHTTRGGNMADRADEQSGFCSPNRTEPEPTKTERLTPI